MRRRTPCMPGPSARPPARSGRRRTSRAAAGKRTSRMTAAKTASAIAAAAAMAACAAGCSSAPPASATSARSTARSQAGGAADAHVTLRLGFLVNVTHAPALVGIREGFFTRDLGSGVTLKLTPFSTGTQEATALLAGQLDAAYVGPNPAIKAWQTSGGKLIRVISGAASGGAALVVRKGITSPAQLKGQPLATPSLGNTQDVALRYWLRQHGLTTTPTGGGDVPVKPMSPNSAAVLAFQSGQVAGGWEPAPYDIEMAADGGHVLVNEASLWPHGQFVTTNLVVTQAFLAAHPSVVAGLLKGQIQANDFINQHTAAAEADVNAELAAILGKGLTPAVLKASFRQITFTDDPIASSLLADARHAVDVGLLRPVSDLQGIYDLGPLNRLLAAAGEAPVKS
jgi:NitT/TauT family transport system substrate-binding protein